MDNIEMEDDVIETGLDLDREDFKFSEFGLSTDIIRSLDEMGYFMPTAVQKNTIEPALERKDLIVLSKTGSGKTAAFGVPALQLLQEKKLNKVLILAPTRELAVQVEQEISTIGKYLSVKSIVVYGKHSIDVEIDKIKKGCDILVGTPGRVLDHIEQENFNPRDFDLVILDEADRMLDMGFIDQVDKIISHTSKRRTTFLFSATIPEEIVKLSAKYLDNPYTIELSSDVKTVEEVEQFYICVKRNEKRSRLLDVLGYYKPESCIVFCNTRHEVDRVADFLVNYGITSKSIHGANSQSLRLKFLNQFKKGGFRVLVATDVAARGLHIEGLELVINYNIPVEKDSYVHRIGRTGRAGKKGLAISFVQEGELYQMFSLEEHVGVRIEEIHIPRQAATRKETENAKDLYGISFRELTKYDPEATENTSRHTSTEDKLKEKQAQKKKKKRRSKKVEKPENVPVSANNDKAQAKQEKEEGSRRDEKNKATKEKQPQNTSGTDAQDQKAPGKKRRRRRKNPNKAIADVAMTAGKNVPDHKGVGAQSENLPTRASTDTGSSERANDTANEGRHQDSAKTGKKGFLSKMFRVFKKGGEKK